MMYRALLIAKYIINYYNSKHRCITNAGLQKLLYYIQAGFLIIKGTPCFKEEIKAWHTGAVVPDVYRVYKIYGNSHIPNQPIYMDITKEDKVIIENIINENEKYFTYFFESFIKSQTPWIKAYHSPSKTIVNSEIKDFFSDREVTDNAGIGRWHIDNEGVMRCNQCGSEAPYYWQIDSDKFIQSETQYCPDCGYKMRGVNNGFTGKFTI